MKKIRRYNVTSKSYSFLIKLIKTRYHFRNMMVLLIEDEIISSSSKKILRNFKSFGYLIRNTYKGKTNEKEYLALLEEINSSEKLTQLFNEIQVLFTIFSSKFLLQVVKEIETSYKASFTNLKNKNITSFTMKTKRLSKVNEGSINFDSNIVRYRNGYLVLNVFAVKHSKNNTFKVYVGDKKYLSNTSIANCTIYCDRFKNVEVLLTYEDGKEILQKQDNGNCLSIDPGLNNHLSVFVKSDNTQRTWLIRNRAINRVNNECFRILPKISSELDNLKNSNIFNTRYRSLKYIKNKLYNKRKVIIRNELHKITNRIIEACLSYNINTIVLGYNKSQKNGINIGKTNNKEFLSIPHSLIKEMLDYKCKEHGITLILQEESYTSKLSCLSDTVWKYEKGKTETNESNGIRGISKKGKKITSLFKDKFTKLIYHADINGAVNILQKYLKTHVSLYTIVLTSPLTIRDDFKFLSILR